MPNLAIADVVDLDCVVSWRPLALDLPATERYARGANAIVRRVLYSWVRAGKLLELPGRTLSPGDLAVVRSRLSRLAEEEDYVEGVTLDMRLDRDTGELRSLLGTLIIDGQNYPLSVATGNAGAAIAALGGV